MYLFSCILQFLLFPDHTNPTVVLIYGVPDPSTSYPTQILTGVNSKDCAEKCSTDANCIMSFGNISEVCYLYSVGDLIKVQTDGEGSDNKIGLKVQNNFTKCAPSELLLSAPSVYRNPPIKSYKFSADTPTSYTINYGVPKQVNPIAPSSKSWKECMYECYKDSHCYMAYMKNYPNCRMAYYGNVDNVIRIETPPMSSTALHFAAIKYVTDDITCTMNFTSLWTAGRPMKSETSASNYSAYQPTTSGLKSTFSWIGKNAGCVPGFTEKIAGVSGCVRLVLFNNLTVNRSSAIAGCYKYGTYGLMTISSSEAFSVFRKAMMTISRQAGTYHIGLSRKTATSAWQWDFPELEIDKSGIVWASGEPKSPNLYAYLDITSTTAVLISSSASQTVDGQFCYVPS